jgi:hypothetical protein
MKNLVSQPLSGDSIKKKVGYDINVLKYSELNNYNSVDEILKNGVCVLLYETEPNHGHWVVLLKTVDESGNQILEIFDPYGMDLESEKRFINKQFLKSNNMDHNILAKMLYNSPYPSSYNQYHFQTFKDNVSTCGRWVIARIKNKNLSLEDFHEKFKNYSDKDISKLY